MTTGFKTTAVEKLRSIRGQRLLTELTDAIEAAVPQVLPEHGRISMQLIGWDQESLVLVREMIRTYIPWLVVDWHVGAVAPFQHHAFVVHVLFNSVGPNRVIMLRVLASRFFLPFEIDETFFKL